MLSSNLYIVGWRGYIGQSLLNYLGRTGFTKRVFLYSRNNEVESITHDFIDATLCQHDDFVSKIAQDNDPVVYYLANSISPAESQSRAIESVNTNLLPFIRFLEDIKSIASKVTFIFASSGGTIYGDTGGEKCREDHALSPKTIYAANKLAQESYLQVYHCNYGLNYRVLRIANPYGPGQVFKGGQGLIPAIMDSYKKKTPVKIYGDGSASRDYIYIDDLHDCFIKSAVYKGDVRIFNVGSDSKYSILDIIDNFNRHGIVVDTVKVKSAVSVVNSISLDITRAKREFNWSPQTSLEDGLKKYIEWYELTLQ
ncbi:MULTISPECIES: NAD-dependent epimerase/dehydratase family protein [Pantoea]|uniref:NAD-dependent epimerase/dehydratase family protein n=1 Tax=Pantoea TaxID=53335 RepID=UPI0021199A05|nr:MULTISPECIES: NAD-dependent epimerase/dehydratase family protein [Pantoea]MDN4622073.1 NAD-dependent epimerase/dehydratase family protein [Pantoea agglomerans]